MKEKGSIWPVIILVIAAILIIIGIIRTCSNEDRVSGGVLWRWKHDISYGNLVEYIAIPGLYNPEQNNCTMEFVNAWDPDVYGWDEV